jgi:hypothetical protein
MNLRGCITMDKNIEMYLDYWNNFLTVERFAEYHNITKEQANHIIKKGKEHWREQYLNKIINLINERNSNE